MAEREQTLVDKIALLEKKLAAMEIAESRLLAENALFRKLYDQAPVGYQSLDENGCLLSVNQTWLDTLGYSREEAIGRNFREFLHPEWQDKFARNFPRFMACGEIHDVECKMVKKHGASILICINGKTDRNSEGLSHQTHCIFHDITEYRRVQEEYKLFFDLVPDMVCIATTDGRFRKLNRAWQSVLGYSMAELLVIPFFELVHPDDREATNAEIARQIAGKYTTKFINRYRHKDGSYRWFEWHATPVVGEGMLFAVARDITERKKAEQTLYETNAVLQAAMDNSPAGIAIADAPYGKLRYMNDAGLSICGRHRKPIVDYIDMSGYLFNWHLFDLDGCTPLNTQEIPLARSILYGETCNREFIIRRAHDDDRIVFANAAPIRDESGKITAGIVVFTDITERKRVEVALRKSEEHLHTLVQTIPDLIWLKDKNGTYISCNATFERFFGAKDSDIIGKTDYDFVSKELADFFVENDHKAIAAGKPVSNEEWITFADDGRHALLETIKAPMYDSLGTLIGILGIGRDITQRKQAEENYQKLFHEMLDGCALHEIVRDETGKPISYRFLAVNSAFERLTGLKATDIIGRIVQEVLPKVENHWIESYGRVVITGEPAYFESISGDLKKYFEVRAYRPAPNQFACIFADISERKIAEEERKLLQIQLQHAQKMEAIGTLAGGIAHDFNNILGAILGYAEMAREDCLSGSVNPKDLDQVIQAGNRAKDLVKQILAFSRQAETEKTPLRPAAIIKESLKLLRSSIPKTIDIRSQIEDPTDLILADPTQVHQIVMNLCTNAYHAMEEVGGILTLSLRNKYIYQNDVLNVPNVKPGHFVQLAIRDTGTGIPWEIKEKIFDPYFTTKEMGKGTGLGLAIVHGIVKNYGGFITCHSEIGKGTTFEINLPAFLEEILPSQETAITSLAIGTEHILFVDDEEMLAEMGKTMLERLGYTVTIRTNSLEALTTFKYQPDAFDLVITDQTMPGITGYDLARGMLQIRPGLPIILCTGYSSTISEEKAKSLGIKGFALKPVAKQDLSTMIRTLLDGRTRKERFLIK